MESIDDITKYFKIRKTTFKMLEDRGYIVSGKDKNESLEIFKDNYKGRNESMNVLVQRAVDDKDFLYVEFSSADKISVQDITSFAERLHEQNIKSGILVIKGSISPLAKMVI